MERFMIDLMAFAFFTGVLIDQRKKKAELQSLTAFLLVMIGILLILDVVDIFVD